MYGMSSTLPFRARMVFGIPGKSGDKQAYCYSEDYTRREKMNKWNAKDFPPRYAAGDSVKCPDCGHYSLSNRIHAESGYGMVYYNRCERCGAQWLWDTRSAWESHN